MHDAHTTPHQFFNIKPVWLLRQIPIKPNVKRVQRNAKIRCHATKNLCHISASGLTTSQDARQIFSGGFTALAFTHHRRQCGLATSSAPNIWLGPHFINNGLFFSNLKYMERCTLYCELWKNIYGHITLTIFIFSVLGHK